MMLWDATGWGLLKYHTSFCIWFLLHFLMLHIWKIFTVVKCLWPSYSVTQHHRGLWLCLRNWDKTTKACIKIKIAQFNLLKTFRFLSFIFSRWMRILCDEFWPFSPSPPAPPRSPLPSFPTQLRLLIYSSDSCSSYNHKCVAFHWSMGQLPAASGNTLKENVCGCVPCVRCFLLFACLFVLFYPHLSMSLFSYEMEKVWRCNGGEKGFWEEMR